MSVTEQSAEKAEMMPTQRAQAFLQGITRLRREVERSLPEKRLGRGRLKAFLRTVASPVVQIARTFRPLVTVVLSIPGLRSGLKAARKLAASAVLTPLRAIRSTTIDLLKRFSRRYRSTIREWIGKVVDRFDSGEPSSLQMAMFDGLVRIAKARVPLVSRAALGTIHIAVMTLTGTRLAAGNLDEALRLARLLNLAFRPYIRRRQLPTAYVYFQVLFYCRQYARMAREVPGEELIAHHYLNHCIGVAHLYCWHPDQSRFYLEQAMSINSGSYPDHRMLGRAHLLKGELSTAARHLSRSVDFVPGTVMAHQNYAGRYDTNSYEPPKWELRRSGPMMIYDNFGQLAEDFFLLGNFEASFRCYQAMLDFQKRWKRNSPLPKALKAKLAAKYKGFDPDQPTRLLPYEWVTQFGHIGLLDIYTKMMRLGRYPQGNHLLLAPADKVANKELLALWEPYFTIVREETLVNKLFPWQRIIGDNFMAILDENGEVEPWTLAGAKAQVEWAIRKRAPILTLSKEARSEGEKTLAKMRLPKGAWYVGLHVREGGFYTESKGSISTHRNSRVEDYFSSVKAITDAGGVVIRLGDKSMTKLPKMEGVIDYAHSPHKSQSMDIFLAATCRFVIGTTSGLTTVCLGFDTPMVLVNCISNDWQLWSGNTDFIIKKVRDTTTGRMLPFAETYRQPMQGYLINNLVMQRKGYEILPNTEAEIEAAIRDKLEMVLSGKRPSARHPLLKEWRAAMADNPAMFGAAKPCLSFLKANRDLLTPAIHIPPIEQEEMIAPIVFDTIPRKPVRTGSHDIESVRRVPLVKELPELRASLPRAGVTTGVRATLPTLGKRRKF